MDPSHPIDSAAGGTHDCSIPHPRSLVLVTAGAALAGGDVELDIEAADAVNE